MRIFLMVIFSLFLTACNKTSTTEKTPSIFGSSVQIEGEYKGEFVTTEPQKFVFKPNGIYEFHQYYSNGKLVAIYSGMYNIVNKTVNITGVSIPDSYEIQENGKKLISGTEVFVKVK